MAKLRRRASAYRLQHMSLPASSLQNDSKRASVQCVAEGLQMRAQMNEYSIRLLDNMRWGGGLGCGLRWRQWRKDGGAPDTVALSLHA